LAWRTAHNHVESQGRVAEIKSRREFQRPFDGYVPCLAVPLLASVKIYAVRASRVRIGFDSGGDFKPCRMEAEGQSATAAEKVQNTRRPAG
jgi:hypothetical protein